MYETLEGMKLRCDHEVVCGITSRVSRYCARHEVAIRDQALPCPVPVTVQGIAGCIGHGPRANTGKDSSDSCQRVLCQTGGPDGFHRGPHLSSLLRMRSSRAIIGVPVLRSTAVRVFAILEARRWVASLSRGRSAVRNYFQLTSAIRDEHQFLFLAALCPDLFSIINQRVQPSR